MALEANLHLAGVDAGTQPDILLPSQYFEPRRNQTPEQRLMIAVFHDALDCLDKYRFATDSHDRRLFDEAKEWFLADETGWPYSFECICSFLGLDSTAVRQRLCVEPAPQISTCDPDPEALETLRRWQFDPRLNGASRRRARTLVWKSQANGWDEA